MNNLSNPHQYHKTKMEDFREEVAELRLLHVAKTTQGKKKEPYQGVTGR